METLLKEIAELVVSGNAPKVEELVKDCLDKGATAEQILYEGLVAGMNVVGERFKSAEMFLPEVIVAARGMQRGMAILEPILSSTSIKPLAAVLLGTVRGDLHDIGKNLVGTMLRGTGFRVIDIGVDVSEERLIEAMKENEPELVGLSALLTTTMPCMRTTIEAIDRAGLRKCAKIMVGGAPVTQDFASKIGADGYAPDAASAVDKAKALLGIT